MTNTDREELRQADLDALQMASLAETVFDDLTRAAAGAFGVPMSSITIMDCGRQWTKSSIGMPEGGRSGDTAFGILAIETPSELTVVEDTMLDLRFAGTLVRRGAPYPQHGSPHWGVVRTGHRTTSNRPGLQQLKFMAEQVVATLEAQ